MCDLTNKHLTEDQFHEILSTYIVINFQKIEPLNKYDSAGQRNKSTWAKCKRSTLANVDNTKARETIQRLNLKDRKQKDRGISLLEKQQSLSQNAQDQIAEQCREFAQFETDQTRFHTVLEQISWTQKSDKDRRSSKKRSISTRKGSVQDKHEKATITAYFKRCPRPDQVASELYYQLDREKRDGGPLSARQQQARGLAQAQARLRLDDNHLDRLHADRRREEDRGRGIQQVQPNQRMPPIQQMPPPHQQQIVPPVPRVFPGQQPQPGPQMQTGPQAPMGHPGPVSQQPPFGQQRQPGQQMPFGQTMPLGQNTGPGQNVDPGQHLPNQQMPPPAGPHMGQQLPGQMPPPRPVIIQQPNGQPQFQQQQPQQQPPQQQRPPNFVQMPPQQQGQHQMRPLPFQTGPMPPPPPQGVHPANQHAPLQPQKHNGNMPPHNVAFQQKRPVTPIRVIHEHNKPKRGRGRSPSPSSSSSRGSTTLFSDAESNSDSELTEPSASGSPRFGAAIYPKLHRRRSNIKYAAWSGTKHTGSGKSRVPRYVTEPANFGKRQAHRRHDLDERHSGVERSYIVTAEGQRIRVPSVPPVVPQATVPTAGARQSETLAQIREAYRAGRADQKAELEAETDAEVVEELGPGLRRSRPVLTRAQIHQQDLAWDRDTLHARYVPRSEIKRRWGGEGLSTAFEGLRIGRDDRLDDERDEWRHRDQTRLNELAFDEQEAIRRHQEEERAQRMYDAQPAYRRSNVFLPQRMSGGLYGRA